MPVTKDINQYYDDLAADYDRSRFANSYGQFLHHQEARILSDWLPADPSRTASLGCGTGRFLEHATCGVDLSGPMLAQARDKYPQHHLIQADLTKLPFDANSFRAAFCLHVLMHLPPETARAALIEAARVIEPDGVLMVDIPSARRRKLSSNSTADPQRWHGASAYTLDEWRQLIAPHWRVETWVGIKWLPVHRVPKPLRPLLWRPLLACDHLLCRSRLKPWASYWMFKLRRIA